MAHLVQLAQSEVSTVVCNYTERGQTQPLCGLIECARYVAAEIVQETGIVCFHNEYGTDS